MAVKGHNGKGSIKLKLTASLSSQGMIDTHLFKVAFQPKEQSKTLETHLIISNN